MVARSRSRAQGAFIALGLALVVALAFSSSIDAARVPVTTSTEAIKSFHAQLQSSTAFLESAEASAIAAKRADEMKTLMMSDAATALAHADELHSFLSKSSSSASHLQLESAFSGTADVELLCPWGAPTDSVPKHEGGCTCWNSITLHAAEGKKTYRSLLPEDHPLAGYPKYGVHVTGYSLEDVAVIHPTAPTHHLESISHSDAQHNFQSKACTTNAKIQSRTGVKNLLFINVDFPDKPGFPRTKDQLLALGQEIDAYYRATSFGKTNVVTSVAAMTNTLRMPRNTATYIAGTGYSLLRQDAEQAANAAGIEVCAYEMEVINFAQIAYQWAGLGAVGAKPAWINGYFDLRVTGHELGHNYGLPHAAFWRTGTTEPLAPGGTSLEYGDTYDVMGGQGTAKGHVNIIFKAKLSWITENVNTKNIPTTDTLPNGFTGLIGPMDLAGYGGATLAGVSVQRTNEIPAGYAFWLSTRSLFPEAIGQLNFHTEIREYAIPGSYLLDLHGETASLADSGLYPGESYSDCGQKIHITNAGMQPCPASTAANPIYCVNAVVKKGDNPNNTPFKLTVSPKTATAGQPVTFTAASDATYFSWRVDNVAASGASFTYNMPAAQNNVYKKVTVILADGLGRRARYAYALAVGNPAGAAPDYTADMYRYSCATGRQAGYAPAPMDGGANVPTTPQPVSYAWVAKQFSDCSTRVANPNDQSKWCGGGTASRSVTCTDAAGQPVGDNMCSAAGAKPAEKLPCDTNACSTYQWATTEFSMCSLPCGGGVQTRSVTCQTATSSNADVPLGAVVDEVNCKDSKPSSTAACNTQACATFGWVAAAYGECSKSCGGGVQTRDVVCKSSASAGVVPVNTPFRLTNRQSGNYLAVAGNSQTAAAMTASSAIAASSSTFTLAPTPTTSQVYIQTTHITNIAQLVVTSTAAGVATATKGTDATQFFSFTDKGDGYFQIISSGQALDVTAAGAVIRAAPSASTSQLWRFARVDGQPISQSAVVADSNCNMAGSKPDAQQTCNTAACGQYSWLLGTFGQCQCATGATDGTQTRTVSCQDSTSQAAAADAQCPAPKPSVSQSCQCSSCTQDCNTPYGFCSMVDNQPTCKCAAGVGGDDCKSLPTVSNVKVSQVGVPDSATSVKAGDSVVVSWTVIGGATAQITGVNILLWHPNGIAPGYVARNVPNTGSYLWLVNVDHLEGPHYVEVSLIGVDQIVKTAKAQSGTFPIIDPCKVLGINCQHGKCSLGVCACESGWTGNACNTPQQCFDAGRTCNGHGDCSLVGSNQPFCNCTDGYTNGPAGNCERKTGCGMTCVRGAPDDTCQSCVCPAGSFYTSRDMCSTCGLTCNGRGTANSACSACTCQAGYGGLNCNQQVSSYTVRVFLSGSGELTDEQKGAFAKLVIADLTSLLNKPGQTPIRVQTANSDPAASITKDPSVASAVYWFKFQVWQQLSAEVAPVDQPTPTTPPGQVVGQTINVLAVMRAAFNDAKSEFFSGVSASMLDTTSLAIDTSTPPPATRSPNQQAGSASSVHAQSFTFFVTLLAVAAAAARRA